MADTTPHSDNDSKVRANIAYWFLGGIFVLIAYTLYMYGHILAILTLILGWLTGTANILLSPYFGSPNTQKKPDAQIVQTGDSPTATTTDTENKQ